MEKVLVYAIVVSHNGLKWLDKCFGSLLSSSTPVKVIAIDNASTDGTPEYIKKHYYEVELIENSKNLGFGQANNIGIRKAYDAGADYVFLLNQDAWVEYDSIDKLVEAASEDPEFGVISPMQLNKVGDKLEWAFSQFISSKTCPGLIDDMYFNRLNEKIYEIEFVNAAAWLISRKCIQIVGGFNPLFFQYGEDNNFLDRVIYHKLKIGLLPTAQVSHDSTPLIFNKYYKNNERKYLTKILLKYSNPNEIFSINDELSWQRKFIVKKILKFDLSDFFLLYRRFVKIKKLRKEVLQNLKVSTKKGPSFL